MPSGPPPSYAAGQRVASVFSGGYPQRWACPTLRPARAASANRNTQRFAAFPLETTRRGARALTAQTVWLEDSAGSLPLQGGRGDWLSPFLAGFPRVQRLGPAVGRDRQRKEMKFTPERFVLVALVVAVTVLGYFQVLELRPPAPPTQAQLMLGSAKQQQRDMEERINCLARNDSRPLGGC